MRATLRFKLLGIVGVSAACFIALIAVDTASRARSERELRVIRDTHVPRLEQGPRLNAQYERVRRSMQDAVAAQDREALAATDAAKEEFLRDLRAARLARPTDNAALAAAFGAYYAAASEVARRLIEGESGEELVELMTAMQAHQLRATDLLRKATTFDQGALAGAFGEMAEAGKRAAELRLVVSLCCIALVLGLSLWISRGLLRAAAELSAGFERFGRGELQRPIAILGDDEIGTLAERANAMARSLASLHDERERSDWLKTGHSRLILALQGDLEPSELAKRAVGFLTSYLGAPAGALYQLDGTSLRALSHFAAGAESNAGSAPSFRLGEGLVGLAAEQRELVVVDNLPADYARIRSGLGEASPRALLFVPLIHAERTTGLLELASWQPWPELHRELVLAVRETLAIAIEVATARAMSRELLAQTQRLAERLGAQEEELRATNEELQAQQEELRRANGELRAQAAELERRQVELELKNSELDVARQGLETKATELTAVSAYKSQFLANMSHELRTPLNSMLLLSNLLADNEAGNLTAKQVEFCRTIHGAGKDLLSLINQVLDLAKIESGKQIVNIEPVDLRQLREYAERVVGPLARDKGLEFIAELSPDAPAAIGGDRQKLEQILNNLLGNAVKFTERGSVRLSIGPAESATVFDRPGLDASKMLRIAVTDTGIGIAPEHQRSVFVEFEQVDGRSNRRYGGTGLGLAIARQLTHLLGGELQLHSAPGQGSTFACYVPARTATAANDVPPPAVPALPRSPVPASRSSDCMLVIEDDALFAQSVCEAVQNQGFTSLLARDGRQGLRLAKEHHPRGVILDVRLPDIDGFAVMQALREDTATASIPVHFVSALEAADRGLALGAIGYLTKPASRAELVQMVQALAPHVPALATRVLVVEDDPQQADSLGQRLRGEGIEFVHAADARAALQTLAAERFQCIVLDLGLPDMDGLELLHSIEELRGPQRPPVVVYTGRPLSKTEAQRLEAYADAVVLKESAGVDRLLDEVKLFARRLRSGPAPRPKLQVEASATLAGSKLLIVDDDMRTVYALSALLRAKNAEVVVADNGHAALAALDEHPDVNVVLMDIMMPEMDGYEAMRRIRLDPRFEKLPMIALTAKAMKGDREKCLDAGATDYLSKPIDQERLLESLHRALDPEVQRAAG